MRVKLDTPFGSGFNALSTGVDVNNDVIDLARDELSDRAPKCSRHGGRSSVGRADEVSGLDWQSRIRILVAHDAK